MKSTENTRIARGRGRPRLDEEAPTVRISVQVTEPQKDKLVRLGGSAWVRDKIDKAKEPTSKE